MADINDVLKGVSGACAHNWVSNSGQGGEPDFRPNRQMSHEPLMHVMCSACKCRTWFTEAQWNELPRRADRGGA